MPFDVRRFFRNLLQRDRVERELDEELNSYLEMLVDEKLATGMSYEEARRAARLELGGLDQVKESVRDVRMGAWVDRLVHDTRAASRSLAKARGFSGVAISTLAVGLTLCTITLTVLNAYFVRELPYPAADRLYSVQYAPPGSDPPRGLRSVDWRALGDVIEHTIAWDLDMFYLTGMTRPERAPGAWVTPGFIEGYGVRPAIGRNFDTTDFQLGRPQVALISHRLWQGRFGGDGAVVGRRFQAYVSDRPDEPEVFTIVGVLPEGFWHLNPFTDILVPLRSSSYPYTVRVRKEASPGVVAERMTALVRSGSQTLDPAWEVSLISTKGRYVAEMRPVVRAVTIAVGLVFLITCANVAMLFLVRTKRKEPELAMRLALGSTRGQLARLILLEALLLGAVATATGLVCGRLLMAWLGPQAEQQLGRMVPGGLAGFELDGTVIAGTVACGLLSTCIFMLAPMVTAWRTNLELPRSSSAQTEGARRLRARSLLVAFEVAASLALLTGSALLVESAYRMLRVDFGIDTERTLMASLSLRQRSYPDVDARAAFYERIEERLANVPGFQAVAMSDLWPLQAPRRREVARTAGGGVVVTEAGVIGVSSDYFETLNVPLREGRVFAAYDRWEAERVAVVSETLARRLEPQSSIVGQRLQLRAETPRSAGEAPLSLLVVGVVADVRQTHTDEDFGDLYMPLVQRGPLFAWILARVPAFSPTWEDEIWTAVSGIDPDVSLGPPQILQTGVDDERARPRFLASLLSGFATFAGVLAVVGVYSVISYSVRQRQREVAVRMAVGADRSSVALLFLRQGGIVLAGGLTLGVGCALAVSRALESQLYGVHAGNPRVLVLTTLAFGVCGLLAIAWPAMRATSIDPAVTLRGD